VIARDEQWKMGQFKPGDQIRFHAVVRSEDPVAGPAVHASAPDIGSPIVGTHNAGPVSVVYRRQGDDNLLVEYGPMALDIALRLRVHLLMQAIAEARLPGLLDLTPGIRSLQIHYDGTTLTRKRLLGLLADIETSLPPAQAVTVPSRIVHLPLSWSDPDAELAMRKYQELVRPNAPWCPSNIEFIRRINGLADEQAVKDIVFDASYLVLGLGDVYLGAPVATPVDPRHRLVTTKYNPARTWTEPICASMAWRDLAATSCSAAPSRSGTHGGRRQNSPGTSRGCSISSIRSVSSPSAMTNLRRHGLLSRMVAIP
jgi:urea carboxylase